MVAYRFCAVMIILAACCLIVHADPTRPWTESSPFPSWKDTRPLRTITLTFDENKSSTQNGAALAEAIDSLIAGDCLEIGTGTYSVNKWWNVVLHGTWQNPIRIVAAEGAEPVITRPDANQNVMNVAAQSGDTTTFVCFRGLEFTGGSSMLRLYRCANVWVDSCELHDGGNVGITANSANTEYLYLTRNHVYNPGPSNATSEGMYLGANNSAYVMRYSVIAFNTIHDCGGTQGDGIEIKQGSYNNWIVGNYVYDTNYPCIIAYGTDGKGINVIENNTVLRSNSNTMQVQGEAIVGNNLIISGGGDAFHCHDHQGQTTNLQVIHNTIVNDGLACRLSSWNGRENMVFANNAVYSTGTALNFPNGSSGVTIAGNVVYGSVSKASGGYEEGTGLQDFMDITWDGTHYDARPSSGSPLIGAAGPSHAVATDLNFSSRIAPFDAGAVEYDGATVLPPERMGGIRSNTPTGYTLLYVKNNHKNLYVPSGYDLLGRNILRSSSLVQGVYITQQIR
ncbi:MAG: hypothetical protein GF401_02790 [Chitinivibrionales bacterium]|nr:hypothetical protein [Chitinivibrionales bacterium]